MHTTPTLPARSVMLRALSERDSRFEGQFFFAVRTTGVFCRPTCRSRAPRPENVQFFPTAAEAYRAGFRPCRRCRPTEAATAIPPEIGKLRDALEAAPEQRWSDADLCAAGYDPSTVRRCFRRAYGVTFHAYRRSLRIGTALRTLQSGRGVLEAGLAAGYESASGFASAVRAIAGAPPGRARASMAQLASSQIDTPLGPMLALADDAGVRLLEFTDRRGLDRECREICRRLQARILPGENAPLRAARRALDRYFSTGAMPEIATAPIGSPFQLRVWSYLLNIPAGETRSYSQVAADLGIPRASRAVGRANGSNRIALLIPCHRVIASDGSLSGYSGGVSRKRWLLQLEQRAQQAHS
ncbi:MAG: bifunctional transcriptional activator/DNA repair protein Ada [Planctomycetes bacterium]|nr:bifunctional transcriptional activator/DNA repair protein Ada [Planctomycetota bacterium]